VFRILNKRLMFACLLAIGISCLCLFIANSRAAEFGQTSSEAGAQPGNFSSPADSVDDVRVVITTYRDGNISQTATTAKRPASNDVSTEALTTPVGNVPAAAGDIVFSQIYSNGGNPGSTYQNNYLELFNRTNNTIDISGWPIYIADATGTFDQAIAFTSSRGIGIGAGRYLLIQFGDVSSNGSPLPNPDLIAPYVTPPPPGFPPPPPLNIKPSGKVFITTPGASLLGSSCPLPNSQIVDFVGYGNTANCFEGSGPTATITNTTAALRKAGGCTDSDNNVGDFDVSAPTPRNGSTTAHFCNPAPPVIQFSQASFNVTENSGSIGLLVTRTGNTSAASTVEYVTSDSSGTNDCDVVSGSASSRCDYIASIGTLKFAPGETFRLIGIPLIDDAYAEGTENFSVILSGPTGATLGTPATTTIVIGDNENTNGVNPIDQTGFFVRQHYIDFLGREPDGQGSNYWIGDINNCTPKPECTELKRINVSASFFLSIEFQESGYLAYRAYKTAYGDATGQAVVQNVPIQISVPIIRFPEFLADSHAIGDGVAVGTPNWEQKLESNKVAYFASFVARQRFLTDYPLSMTPTDFVDKLNMRAGNVLSSSERNTLINQLQADPNSRPQVVRAVAESSTLKINESNRAFVLMQYFGYLRRNPNDPQDTDYSGYKFWLDKLNLFNGNFVGAEMVKAFIDSIEYRQRFGPTQ
jgi:hypothetical protein